MNYKLNQNTPKPTHALPYHRVGNVAYDADWNELKVTEKKGWRYLKRGDKHIGVSSLPDLTGYNEPIYFNYLFGGRFQQKTIEYYDRLIRE